MKRIAFFLIMTAGVAALLLAQTDGDGVYWDGVPVFSDQSPASIVESFSQEGIASWYGAEFDGKPTASGEIFNSDLFTAAHPTLPFGTILTITNKQNNLRVTVRINDRGPFVAARIIDLSKAAAEVLDMLTTGTAPVILEQAAENAVLGPTIDISPPEISVEIPLVAAQPPIISPQEVIVPLEPIVPQESYVPVEVPVIVPTPTPAPSPTPSPPPVIVQETPPVPVTAVTPARPEPTVAPVPPRHEPAITPPPPRPETAAPAPGAPQVMYPAPPARILGGIPPANSTRFYRLQVGAYRVPRNAVDVFDKLKNAGLNPAYEQHGDIYRVVLPGLRAAEIPSIAQILGNIGFPEALIREETGR